MRPYPLVALLLLTSCVPSASRVEGPGDAGNAVRKPPLPPPPVIPAPNPPVGGVVLPSDRPIADLLPIAPGLGGFARAVATAARAETLRGAGPLTLFAPSDAALARLQPGTLESLARPENRAALVKLVDLHVVPGTLDSAELLRRIAAGGGRAAIVTMAGETLTATLTTGIVTLTDAGGDRSYVEIADVRSSNGVIHLVNGVLVPRLP